MHLVINLLFLFIIKYFIKTLNSILLSLDKYFITNLYMYYLYNLYLYFIKQFEISNKEMLIPFWKLSFLISLFTFFKIILRKWTFYCIFLAKLCRIVNLILYCFFSLWFIKWNDFNVFTSYTYCGLVLI